ncbi:hypothetical protein F4782DRAFT_326419 [Xylaria castorea]|nr:hypothetical protein F4782DRAFT_326419 [Xylaria castorea]
MSGSGRIKKGRRGAQGAHKVKTGCLTCKIRHKKCDEIKPACSQCKSTGRNCDFQGLLNPFHRQIYPGHSKVWSLAGQLWSTPPLHLVDAWYFEYFKVVCAKELSLSLGTDLWESFVLPAALTEPFIMHGILAVGALSRDRIPSRFSGRSISLTGYSASYPLRKYNQAIQELNKRLDASCRSRELALVGSLIFAVVEAYQGRDDIAQMHIHSALSILESPKSITTGEFQSPPDLYRLFHCLSSHSRVNSPSFSSVIHHISTPVQALQLGLGFETVSEARDSLNSINGAVHSIYRRRVVGAEGSSPLHATHSAGEISGLSRQLDLWHTHFSALKARSTADVETTTCTQILLIHHHIAKLHLSSEAEHSHTSQFSSIIKLSADILRAEERSRTTTMKPTPGHSLDIAITQPLFYTACRCKDGIIRRRAIELLEKVDGASSYDTQLLARVARWVVAMEEKASLESGHPGGFVKEEDMLYDIELDVGNELGRCDITAWRRDNLRWLRVSGYVHAG